MTKRHAVGEPDAFGERGSGATKLFGQIEHRDGAALFGERARRPADAAADVEHTLARAQTREAQELERRVATAKMEVVAGGEIHGGEPVGILSRGTQTGEDRLEEPLLPVMTRDGGGGFHRGLPPVG